MRKKLKNKIQKKNSNTLSDKNYRVLLLFLLKKSLVTKLKRKKWKDF